MLSKRERYERRVNYRYFERQSLRRSAPYQDIPPHRYQRHITVPLGIEPEPPSEYEINNSTIEIRSGDENCTNIQLNTDSDDTSDSSISRYTIRVYNRLEGRWELPEPQPYRIQEVFDQYYEEEDARLNSEPHPPHNIHRRKHYAEYHRLRVYNNDTDSSFDASSINDTESNTTDISYDTDSNNTFTSECTTLTWLSRRRLYWSDHNYNTGVGIDFEIDSTGDFPLQYYDSSPTTSSSTSQNRSAGYATQEPDPYDSQLDIATGRYNSAYWRRITGRDTAYCSTPPLYRAHPDTTTTTTRTTTTHTNTGTTNPLPVFSNRQHLPLPAARKTVQVPTINSLPVPGNRQHLPLLAARKTVQVPTTNILHPALLFYDPYPQQKTYLP